MVMLESFEEAYSNLRPYIKHVHIHDGTYLNNETKIDICLLGEGVINHKIPIGLLNKEGYSGHISVEVIGKGEPDKWLSQYAGKFREIEGSLKE